jgi:hypothetical protein
MNTSEWGKYTDDYLRMQIDYLKTGKEITCPDLYVIPNKQVEKVISDFVEHVKQKQWYVMLVSGGVGWGKSTFLSYTKNLLRGESICISHIVITDKEIKEEGALVEALVRNLQFPERQTNVPLFDKLKDDLFKDKMQKAIKTYYDELVFWNKPLTIIFDILSRPNSDRELIKAAHDWLNGIIPSKDDVDGKNRLAKLMSEGISSKTKSIYSISIKDALYFLKTLVLRMEYNGLYVILDEIEKVAAVSKARGKKFLDDLRDLINIIYQSQSDTQIQKGLFIAFAISAEYLFYSGLVPDKPKYIEKGREKPIKPKTLLSDSERLASIITNMSQNANVEFEEIDIAVKICQKIVSLYEYVYKKRSNINVDGWVREQYEKISITRPRDYVMALINTIGI